MFSQFDPMLVGVFAGFSGVVKALIILIVMFILAKAGKKCGVAIASKFAKDEKYKAIPNYIGNLVYLIIILFFLPGICEALGAKSIAAPIVGMMNKLWGFLPNIIGAGIVLTVGKMIAKLAKELIVPLLDKLDVWQGKYCEKSCVKVSQSIGNIIYVFILIPVIISALEVLHLDSMTRPAVKMLGEVLEYIPLLAGSILIALIGMVIGKLAGNLTKSIVGATGIDAKVANLIGREEFSLSNILASIVHVLIVVFFAVEALAILQLKVLTRIGMAVVAYIPNAIGAVVILLGAYMLVGMLKKMFSCDRIIAGAVYTVAVMMILSQLRIAPYIVNSAFLILMFGVALAFAISVGRGASDSVKEYLEEYRKDKKEDADVPFDYPDEE